VSIRIRQARNLLAGALALLLLVFGTVRVTPAQAQNAEESAKAEWQDRYQTLTAKVERLRADYASRSNSYSKARHRNYPRGEELDKMRADVERLEQELAAAEQELADFPDEARRAGALPGWFR
jgi:peptidoglycan hydrolase CwlO-like protein